MWGKDTYLASETFASRVKAKGKAHTCAFPIAVSIGLDRLTLPGQMHEVNLSRTRRTVELVMGIVD
jgi:hypothetical protein